MVQTILIAYFCLNIGAILFASLDWGDVEVSRTEMLWMFFFFTLVVVVLYVWNAIYSLFEK